MLNFEFQVATKVIFVANCKTQKTPEKQALPNAVGAEGLEPLDWNSAVQRLQELKKAQ